MIGGFHVLSPWSLYFCQYVGCADLAFFFFSQIWLLMVCLEGQCVGWWYGV